jgi:hypothetical protein
MQRDSKVKKTIFEKRVEPATGPAVGVRGWLFNRFRRSPGLRPRLELIERITVAPRQSLVLVEADGRRFLVATSPEGAPAFYALDGGVTALQTRSAGVLRSPRRVTW